MLGLWKNKKQKNLVSNYFYCNVHNVFYFSTEFPLLLGYLLQRSMGFSISNSNKCPVESSCVTYMYCDHSNESCVIAILCCTYSVKHCACLRTTKYFLVLSFYTWVDEYCIIPPKHIYHYTHKFICDIS